MEIFLRLKPLLLSLLAEERSLSRQYVNLVPVVLIGWFRRGPDGERLLSSVDLRETLIITGEEQRLSVLRLIAEWAEELEEYAGQTVEFLDSVWPRQLAVRSPAASTALADLALRAGDRLPLVTAAVLPILENTAIPIDAQFLANLADDERISRFPLEHLALFYAVLPEDAQLWPWGMSQLVGKLAEVTVVSNDYRLTELRRRLARI